jgi:hypothetical protein
MSIRDTPQKIYRGVGRGGTRRGTRRRKEEEGGGRRRKEEEGGAYPACQNTPKGIMGIRDAPQKIYRGVGKLVGHFFDEGLVGRLVDPQKISGLKKMRFC